VSLIRSSPTGQTGEGHDQTFAKGESAEDLRTLPGQNPVGAAHVKLL
jgi:hypothetical protein